MVVMSLPHAYPANSEIPYSPRIFDFSPPMPSITFPIQLSIGFLSGVVVTTFVLKTLETRLRARKYASNQVVTGNDSVEITDQSIDILEITSRVSSPKAGAIAVFSGVTRDNFDGKRVIQLE